MEFEFDVGKDAINRAKHGIALRFATLIFDSLIAFKRDNRTDYGEERFIAYGNIEGRLYVCVYTDRESVRRIISLRKANKREQNAYRQNR